MENVFALFVLFIFGCMGVMAWNLHVSTRDEKKHMRGPNLSPKLVSLCGMAGGNWPFNCFYGYQVCKIMSLHEGRWEKDSEKSYAKTTGILFFFLGFPLVGGFVVKRMAKRILDHYHTVHGIEQGDPESGEVDVYGGTNPVTGTTYFRVTEHRDFNGGKIGWYPFLSFVLPIIFPLIALHEIQKSLNAHWGAHERYQEKDESPEAEEREEVDALKDDEG